MMTSWRHDIITSEGEVHRGDVCLCSSDSTGDVGDEDGSVALLAAHLRGGGICD